MENTSFCCFFFLSENFQFLEIFYIFEKACFRNVFFIICKRKKGLALHVNSVPSRRVKCNASQASFSDK